MVAVGEEAVDGVEDECEDGEHGEAGSLVDSAEDRIAGPFLMKEKPNT